MKEYRTKDLLMSAIVKSLGGKISKIDWKKDYAVFVFDNSDGNIDKILNDVANGNAMIEVGELIKSFKTLKSMLEQ
jgi:hypothetical protein